MGREPWNLYQTLITLFILTVTLSTLALTFKRQFVQEIKAEEKMSSLQSSIKCKGIDLESFAQFLTLEELENLYITAKECVKEPVVLEGRVEVLVVDYFDEGKSEERYTLVTDREERIAFWVARVPSLPLASGDRVRIKGFLVGKNLFLDGSVTLSQPPVEESGIEILAQEEPQAVIGEQKTIVILANFQDTQQPDLPKEIVQNVVFNRVNNYYVETSYYKISLNGDVIGWYDLDIDRDCIYEPTVVNTTIATVDPDVFFPSYSRLIIIAPFFGCGWIAKGSVGKYAIKTDDGVVPMSVSLIGALVADDHIVIAHELGHNFTNRHANFLFCGDVPISDDWRQDCQHHEYRDLYDIMGKYYSGHFNAPHKEHVGWFEPTNILTVTQSGTYTLEPIETATIGLKALKIPRTSERDFLYVEYRQPIGFDKDLARVPTTDVYEGALVHITPAGLSSTYLIDVSPTTSDDKTGNRTPALKPGMTLTDPSTGTTITTVSRDASSIRVNVTLGGQPQPTPTPTFTPTPTPTVAPPECPYPNDPVDFNCDRTVELSDILSWRAVWVDPNHSLRNAADFDHSASINILDQLYAYNEWLAKPIGID